MTSQARNNADELLKHFSSNDHGLPKCLFTPGLEDLEVGMLE
jgi:hypothetical protein